MRARQERRSLNVMAESRRSWLRRSRAEIAILAILAQAGQRGLGLGGPRKSEAKAPTTAGLGRACRGFWGMVNGWSGQDSPRRTRRTRRGRELDHEINAWALANGDGGWHVVVFVDMCGEHVHADEDMARSSKGTWLHPSSTGLPRKWWVRTPAPAIPRKVTIHGSHWRRRDEGD